MWYLIVPFPDLCNLTYFLWKKTDFSDAVEIWLYGVCIDVSQTKDGTMQVKTPNYMPKVKTKMVNYNPNFVTGPFSH